VLVSGPVVLILILIIAPTLVPMSLRQSLICLSSYRGAVEAALGDAARGPALSLFVHISAKEVPQVVVLKPDAVLVPGVDDYGLSHPDR
jgi:hypothetical protein